MSKKQSDEAKILNLFRSHDPLWQATMVEVLRMELPAAAPVASSKPVRRRRGPNKPKSTPPAPKPDGASGATGGEE